MGETSIEARREIDAIRDDLTATVDELERRARRVVEVPTRLRERVDPLKFGVPVGAVGLALLGAKLFDDYRERQKEKKLSRWPKRAMKRIGDSAHAGELISRAKRSAIVGGAGTMNDFRDPGMFKKLLWMALSAGTIALAGLLARRVSAAIWEAVLHEPPPTAKV